MTRLALAILACLTAAPALSDTPAPDPKDVEIGSAIFERRCSQCHGLDRVNYKGPWLNGIVGRPAASVEGWAYSEPMKAWGGVWTVENLTLWLTKPDAFIPGTAMNFGGFRTRTLDRDRVIAFLIARAAE
jgi:cytochrome c